MNEHSPLSKIVLTGFSGSGKSTIAPLVASRLGYRCRDLDSELEQSEGESCSELIQKYGLAYFRLRERDLIYKMIGDAEQYVIALGGGAVTIDGIIPFLRENALVVWIQVKLEDVVNRLRSKSDRPLLQGKTRKELSLFLSQRESYYRQAAHLAVDSSSLTVKQIVDRIHDFIASSSDQE